GAGGGAEAGWLRGREGDAARCDATVVPIVTGHVDWAALDLLTDIFLAASANAPAGGSPDDGSRSPTGTTAGTGHPVGVPGPAAATAGDQHGISPARGVSQRPGGTGGAGNGQGGEGGGRDGGGGPGRASG